MDEEDKYSRYAHIPIPTYDEAISRPSSSQDLRGPGQISDDAERQGLLGQEPRPSNHAPPTVESPRSSADSDLRLPEVAGDDDNERRRVEEFDYLDPYNPDTSQSQSRLYHRTRSRGKFSWHLPSVFASLSSIRLPSFRSLYSPVYADSTENTTPPTRTTFLERTYQNFPTVPERYRISAPIAARLCGLFTLIILVYLLFVIGIFPHTANDMGGGRYDPESVRIFIQNNVNGNKIREYLSHITGYDHVAGTEGDYFLTEWIREKWIEEGYLDNMAFKSYYVYLNYPTPDGRSVSIVSPENNKWTATLEEETVDPEKQQTLAWHGHSKNGEVTGPLVFANGGSRGDFSALREHGVVTNGSIALMSYHGTQDDPALKIKAAEEAGCIGALIFSDPRDDGSANGAVWPKGLWRPDDAVHRGGVSLGNKIAGDPLTPGWASTFDAERLSPVNNPGLVGIPSLPLAWRDAKVLLSALQGHGAQVPAGWVGGSNGFAKDWFTGNVSSPAAESAPVVHLKNQNDENEKQQIWNVLGLIEGTESPNKKIIVGSHHDAWCFGSVGPGSGSAIMMELVAIFGALRTLGWRPLRTIEFASWDAGEYNLIGSTEYVEESMDNLHENAIAYINVDVGAFGPDAIFRAAGSPLWQKPLHHVLNRVADPDSNDTLRQAWDQHQSSLQSLGANGDYVGFQYMAGTSSIDIGFEASGNSYPSGSCYDSFEWMTKFGDPNFKYSRALTQIWALLILEVADKALLPFDIRAYADAIQGPYIDNLKQYAESQFQKLGNGANIAETGFNLEPLHIAARNLAERAEEFHRFEDVWTASVYGSGGFESPRYTIAREEYNNAIARFETDLLDLDVSDENGKSRETAHQEQFKHVVLGPQTWSTSDGEAYFPLIRKALDVGDWKQAQAMLVKTAQVIGRATQNLRIM